MTTVGISCPLERKPAIPTDTSARCVSKPQNKIRKIFGHVGSMASGQVSGSQPLFTDVFAVRYKFRALSHFPDCVARRKDWHSRCTSMCRAIACNALGMSHRRTFALAMVTLLAGAF